MKAAAIVSGVSRALSCREVARFARSKWRAAWSPQEAVFASLVLALGMLLLVPSGASAQVLIALLLGDRVSNEKFQLGINVSFAAVGLTNAGADFKVSAGVNMYGEIKLSKHFRLQPELGMKVPGGARRMSPDAPGYTFLPIGEPTYDDVVATGQLRRELKYIGIPVYTKYVWKGFGVGVGPQIGFMIDAEDTVSKDEGTVNVKISDNVEAEHQLIDFGIATSLEYAFSPEVEMRSLRLRVKSYYGFIDTLSDNSGDPVRNWNFMLGLDIPIGGAPKKKDPAATPAAQPAPSSAPAPAS